MVLVLIFLGIVIVISCVIIIILCSTIKIEIENFEIKNISTPKIVYDFQIQIKLYLLKKLLIFKIPINKQKLQNNKVIEKLKHTPIKKETIINLDFLEELRNLSPQIEMLQLNLKIGTENVLCTSVIVFLISMVLSIGLPYLVDTKDYSNIKYEITPFYIGKNQLHLQFRSIIYVKMVHIINIIFIYLQKRREEKNERTSNRRSYADSYEQYTRYGRCKYHYRRTN